MALFSTSGSLSSSERDFPAHISWRNNNHFWESSRRVAVKCFVLLSVQTSTSCYMLLLILINARIAGGTRDPPLIHLTLQFIRLNPTTSKTIAKKFLGRSSLTPTLVGTVLATAFIWTIVSNVFTKKIRPVISEHPHATVITYKVWTVDDYY